MIAQCNNCNIETFFIAFEDTDSLGRKILKGECEICGFKRLLPRKTPIEDFEMPFGTHKRKLLKDIPIDYLKWCVENLNGNIKNKIQIYLYKLQGQSDLADLNI